MTRRNTPLFICCDDASCKTCATLAAPGKRKANLWTTIVIGVALGLALAMLSHKSGIDPMAQAVGEMIRRLWT